MTDPRPSTEAGRALWAEWQAGWKQGARRLGVEHALRRILAIEAEARLATPGSDVRTLLAQAIHEFYEQDPGCAHLVDIGLECEKDTDRILATPSGAALARLAQHEVLPTAGPDEPLTPERLAKAMAMAGFAAPDPSEQWTLPIEEAKAILVELGQAAGPSEREARLEALYEAVGAAPATNHGTPRERAVYAAWRAIADHDAALTEAT